MIDTHCHLGLCEPDDAEPGRRRARGSGCGGCSRSASTRPRAPRRSPPPRRTRRCSPRSAAIRTGRRASTMRRPSDRGAGARTRGSRRSARPGSTTTATALRARTSATPSRAQIGIARRVAKPLVIHVRDGGATTDGEALAETFEILRAEATGVEVILHCFSAPPERAFEAAEWGWYCSFAGNVTYPKSEPLREAAREVPDELLLVETDAPVPLAAAGPRASRTSPRTWSRPPRRRRAARGRLRRARGDGRGERRARLRLVTAGTESVVGLGQNFLADTNLLDGDRRARPSSSPATWCSRSAAGRGR